MSKFVSRSRTELQKLEAEKIGLERKLAQKAAEADQASAVAADLAEELEAWKRRMAEMRKAICWRLIAHLRTLALKLPYPFRNAIRALAVSIDPLIRTADNARFKSSSQYADSRKNLSRERFLQVIREAQAGRMPIWLQLPIIDWNVPLYQRPQQLATALGKNNALVVYKTANTEDKIYGYKEVKHNVWVTDDITVFSEVENGIASIYSTSSLNTLHFVSTIAVRNVLIYEYIDALDTSVSGLNNMMRLQRLKQFCFRGGADVIAASARKLFLEAIPPVGADKVYLIPNGVDYDHYANPLYQNTSIPASIRSFRQQFTTVVGYFGALAPWLWHELINELTKSRPDLGFIFIGPDFNGGLANFERRENILFTGHVSYSELPLYAKHFDVGIIPFRHGKIAQSTSPLKLYEYFALEKPVVVTDDMAECRAFDEVLGASNPADFSALLDIARDLSREGTFRSRLKALALANTWDTRAKSILAAGLRVKEAKFSNK
jgi:glycosyltransferase involved in cell wall biosynthesis